MDPDSVMQSRVDARRRLVDMPSAQRNQSDGQIAKFTFTRARPRLITAQARTAVYPQVVRAVDEDVTDGGIGDQVGQRPEIRWRATGRAGMPGTAAVFATGHRIGVARGAGSRLVTGLDRRGRSDRSDRGTQATRNTVGASRTELTGGNESLGQRRLRQPGMRECGRISSARGLGHNGSLGTRVRRRAFCSQRCGDHPDSRGCGG